MHDIAYISDGTYAPDTANTADFPDPVDRSHQSVYQQGWWHDIIAGLPDYREINAVRDNKIVGSLAYIINKHIDFPRVLPWTHLSGPVLASGLSRKERKDIIKELVRKVPWWISTRFIFDADGPDALLFRAALHKVGFSMEIEQNFRELPDAPDVLERVNSEKRKKIKAAMNCLKITDVTPEFFIEFYTDNIKALGKEPYEDLNIARRLLSEGFRQRQVRILAAQSRADGTFHAALAIAEDRTRAFGWMLTYTSGSHYAATRFLFIEAIKYAKEKNLTYDADGAPTEGHIRNYKDILGMTQINRFIMTRFDYAHRIFHKGKNRLKEALPLNVFPFA